MLRWTVSGSQRCPSEQAALHRFKVWKDVRRSCAAICAAMRPCKPDAALSSSESPSRETISSL